MLLRRSISRRSMPSGASPPRVTLSATAATAHFSRESSKENMAPPDAEEYEAQRRRIEELKAEVGSLQYNLATQEKDREVAREEAESELREAKRRAEADFKAKQAAEGEKTKAQRQAAALQNELELVRAEKDTQRQQLDKKARDAAEEARLLQEQLEDLTAAKDEAVRLAEREITDLKSKVSASQRITQELVEEAKSRESVLEKTQTLLSERDDRIGKLKAENLRLKATTGDAETIAIIRRELTDQVTHIRKLEATNRDQLAELKHLRQMHKAVEIVEEEKRSLQRRLQTAEALETELAEERCQRLRLEDERLAWTAYLEKESSTGAVEFPSPEALARALVQERLHSASLLDKIGEIQPELTDRENLIRNLEGEVKGLKSEIQRLKQAGPSGPSADKARARVERQKALALQEVEYLRAQLKTFDVEDATFQPEQYDQQKATRIQELEALVDKYKTELQALTTELNSLEATSASPAVHPPVVGSKRPWDETGGGDAESEPLGQLVQKKRKLQGDMSELHAAYQLLEKELDVKTEQLAAAQRQLQARRVLALRSNPTSDHEAVRAADMKALKLENDELLKHIERKPTLFATVPASQLAAARRETEEARAETASARKSAQRLKEVWAAKSQEFREAVFSTLGWTVSFLPGGKMRVESVYHPSRTDEHENSIVFDGEKGTMKVGGGPRSAFATKIGNNIRFWVRERGSVPCFLAALTLEFYDEQSKTVTLC
ncbi:hypothetical protein P8C59_005028 [Phyllachora maydis]|uniref:Spindle assembly checkpoint component MAD1 n=1 Tax=Phyllachora maydis TaxID=1825666 RepID=A0AAD9I421_9PEZI|nr:hypothetical protein P8C59_005028 [Phyllachora maydis]